VEDNIYSGYNDYENFFNMLLNKSIHPGHIYDTVYKAVMKDNSYALYGQFPKDLKIKALESLLNWYVLTEEYEKCIEIKNLINKLC
tara:strand:+ start:4054 stop:4311 length:258 start_codon:yes stop_codon:yes gene_type:complete